MMSDKMERVHCSASEFYFSGRLYESLHNSFCTISAMLYFSSLVATRESRVRLTIQMHASLAQRYLELKML